MVKLSVFIVFVHFMLGLCKDIKMSKSLYRCRQICYTRFAEDWNHCTDNNAKECKDMCITPPNINNYIPEAFSFLCLNKCDETLEPFALNVTSSTREGSLILATISWDQIITNLSKQCLVTWEVSGGGLMGNLLTDTSTVELSLWIDTVYHVQVTCKNKETGKMRKSHQLIIDTRKLDTDSSLLSTAIPLTSLKTTNNLSRSPIPIPTISSDPSVKNVKRIEDIFLKRSYLKNSKKHLQFLQTNNLSKENISKKIESTVLQSTITTTTEKSTTETTNSHTPSVIRSKLIAENDDKSSTSSSSIFSSLSNNMIYAIIEAIIVFLGILFIYMLIRSSRDVDFDSQTLIDKEQLLVRNEFFSGRRIVHM